MLEGEKMPKSITVELETGAIEIKRLPLGKYADLLKALETLPGQLAGFTDLKSDDLLSKLPAIIGNSLPEVMKIISIAADLPEIEVAQLDLDETIQILLAIFEVNKVQKIADSIKKLTARPAAE
jgi:hypothetical protein